MTLPVESPFPPMEARQVDAIPESPGWQLEPKWDGFRCIAFRDHSDVHLQSKSCKPLGRYFPDIVETVAGLRARKFVLDGELVMPVDGAFSFDELQLRLHPAESRVRSLVEKHRAEMIVFDLLVAGGKDLTRRPLADRRAALEDFADRYFDDSALRLSPATRDADRAREWLGSGRTALDGVVAKRLDQPYQSGERAMLKIKNLRSADCVVGGFRWGKGGGVGSLLLGLYGDDGLLHHVGFTSSFSAAERPDVLRHVEPLRGGEGFSGDAPGGPSRWSSGRDTEWESLEPRLVAEVQYDHVSGGRFRHGTRFLRWRPDKAPRQCTMEQIRVTGTGA